MKCIGVLGEVAGDGGGVAEVNVWDDGAGNAGHSLAMFLKDTAFQEAFQLRSFILKPGKKRQRNTRTRVV